MNPRDYTVQLYEQLVHALVTTELLVLYRNDRQLNWDRGLQTTVGCEGQEGKQHRSNKFRDTVCGKVKVNN